MSTTHDVGATAVDADAVEADQAPESTGPAGRRPPRRRLPWPRPVVLVALVPAVVIVGILVLMLLLSFRSDRTGETDLSNYAVMLQHPLVLSSVRNTILFALMALFWATLIGVVTAWLVERTDLGGKKVVYALVTLGVVMPNFYSAMGWVYMVHPRIGTLNHLLESVTGWSPEWLNVQTLMGMAWVQGLGGSSLLFILVASSIANMDPSLEEAAQMSGARFWTSMRRVTFPLAMPAILGACIFSFTSSLSAFDVPAVLGLPNRLYTFSTFLFLQGQPEDGVALYGVSSAFAMLMVIVALLLSYVYTRVLKQARRYEVITGKGYRPNVIELRRWKAPARVFVAVTLFLAHLLPLFLLAWVSLLPYAQPIAASGLDFVSLDNYRNIRWSLVSRGLSHTLRLAVLGPTLAVAVSLAFSWIVLRTQYRWRLGFDFVAFLPHAIPNVIFAFGALLFTLFYTLPFLDLYGTLALILILYVCMDLSFGTRITNGALIQIHRELEESAQTSGAPMNVVVRRITLPLLRPALVSVWIWLFLGVFRELQIAAFLSAPGNITLPVVIFDTYLNGGHGASAALTLMLMAILLPLLGLYFRLGGRGLWGRQ